MPQVRYAPGALRGLQRLHELLKPRNPAAARRAGETIREAVQVLGHHPGLGRPIEDMPDEYREWVIKFGDSGYLARYRMDDDIVTILAVRHQKEAGYCSRVGIKVIDKLTLLNYANNQQTGSYGSHTCT